MLMLKIAWIFQKKKGVCVCLQLSATACMFVCGSQRKTGGDGSLLPPSKSQGLNSGLLAWQHAPLTTELPPQP